VNQKKSFLPEVVFPQVFYHSDKKLTTSTETNLMSFCLKALFSTIRIFQALKASLFMVPCFDLNTATDVEQNETQI
jgi:hypothetical protein